MRFLFLAMEFKAQITSDNHFIALNEATNTGVVTMEKTLELAWKILAEEKINFNKPQFFSISTNKVMVFINVYWLSWKAKNKTYYFHITHLLSYFLEVNDLKTVNWAVENVIHYCLNKHLLKICTKLSIYLQKVWRKGYQQSWFQVQFTIKRVAVIEVITKKNANLLAN